jgi:hypothetical protein
MKQQPLYDIDDLVCPTVGDMMRGKTGRIMEICIRSGSIVYGLVDLPLSYGKTLYYNEKEVMAVCTWEILPK